jgi:hypothetical protein
MNKEQEVYQYKANGKFYIRINSCFNMKCWYSGKKLNHLISIDNAKEDYLIEDKDLEKEFMKVRTY